MLLNQPAALVLDDDSRHYQYAETCRALSTKPPTVLVPPGPGFELVRWAVVATAQDCDVCTVCLWRREVQAKS